MRIIKEKFATTNGKLRYKVRELNKTDNIVVSADKIEDIRPNPAEIPSDPTSIDTQVFTEVVTVDDLKKNMVWGCR